MPAGGIGRSANLFELMSSLEMNPWQPLNCLQRLSASFHCITEVQRCEFLIQNVPVDHPVLKYCRNRSGSQYSASLPVLGKEGGKLRADMFWHAGLWPGYGPCLKFWRVTTCYVDNIELGKWMVWLSFLWSNRVQMWGSRFRLSIKEWEWSIEPLLILQFIILYKSISAHWKCGACKFAIYTPFTYRCYPTEVHWGV